ncbi:hypothetical protein NQZ68_021672 [Dissostichus eleginoides]|nr:hypothetical protein NQZ68_021672 [Dissostichus eleginoides]
MSELMLRHTQLSSVSETERGREREGDRERGGLCLSEGVVSSSERVALPHHIRLLLTLRAGGARRNLSSVFPLCGHTDNNRTTAGKMVFLLHMVTLYTLSVFSGASAATHSGTADWPQLYTAQTAAVILVDSYVDIACTHPACWSLNKRQTASLPWEFSF